MVFSEFTEFVTNLRRLGLEYFRRFYGPYRALVVSNKDPNGLGRIQIECPRAHLSAENNRWIMPMMNAAGAKHGEFWPPEKGEAVWIFFDNGDPTMPACY